MSLLYWYIFNLILAGVLYLLLQVLQMFSKAYKFEFDTRMKTVDRYYMIHKFNLIPEMIGLNIYYYIPLVNVYVLLTMLLDVRNSSMQKDDTNLCIDMITDHVDEYYGEYVKIAETVGLSDKHDRYMYAIDMAVKENDQVKKAKKEVKRNKKQ